MKVMIEGIIDKNGSLVLTIKSPERFFKKPAKKSYANEVVAHYCDKYKETYGTNPVVTGKTAGIAKRLSSQLSLHRIKNLISHYLKMKDSYFVSRSHDLAVLESSINKVNLSFEMGLNVTTKQAMKQEQTQMSVQAARSWLEPGSDT